MPGSDEKKLLGKWRWIETQGGFGGMLQTPETEKYRLTLEFLPKGILREYRNNELTLSYNYLLEQGKSIHHPEEVMQIKYVEKNASIQNRVRDYFRIQGDTLILKNECYDCFTSIFVREK